MNELSERTDRVFKIFSFLEDKDVLKGFYKASSAKKLLEQRQVNEEAERLLLRKLKENVDSTSRSAPK